MLLSQFSARNSGQRVELEAHWNVAGCSIKQLEELDFGVFQGRVRHVVDECNSDALGPCGVAFDRSRRAQTLSRGPTGRNPAAVNDQWHDIPLGTDWRYDLSRFHILALSSAWARSAIMSSICSMPTLSRSISGVTPTFSCSSGDNCRWVVDAG